VTSSSSPIKSVRELIEFAKANPTNPNYASLCAAPFQLAAELPQAEDRYSPSLYIPYKGSNESPTPSWPAKSHDDSDPRPIAALRMIHVALSAVLRSQTTWRFRRRLERSVCDVAIFGFRDPALRIRTMNGPRFLFVARWTRRRRVTCSMFRHPEHSRHADGAVCSLACSQSFAWARASHRSNTACRTEIARGSLLCQISWRWSVARDIRRATAGLLRIRSCAISRANSPARWPHNAS